MARPASPAVERARARREARRRARAVELQDFSREVAARVDLTMKQRVTLATRFIKNKVVNNISKAVTVGVGPRGGRVVTDRSQPGDFPRAETSQLMRSIFGETDDLGDGRVDGYVGTTLDYGFILEVHMDRSFLVRTLDEEINNVRNMLGAPIR